MAQDKFLGDPMFDRIMLIVTNLAEELYVTQDRLNVIEDLLDDRGIVRREDIEKYQPSARAGEQPKRSHHEFVARLLNVAVGGEPGP